MAFLLSYGFNFLKSPTHRKWYSTLTGLFLGFYFHGLSYTICIFQFAIAYPCMVLLSRKHAQYAAVILASIIMTIRSFFCWWETILDGAPRLQCTVIFMRVHMTMSNFVDAELLDDPVKGKYLTSRERHFAEYLRKVPSFMDWFNYNMFTPFSFIGESIEYGIFDDFINYRGDITKMRPYSNIFPAVRRQIESIICFSVFYSLSFIAEPLDMVKPEFLAHPFWYKVVFLVLAANCKINLLFSRFVYHEAGLIATGISYRARGEKTTEEYNSIRCMDILAFTWSPTAKESISNWNMRTQHWLKYYIMLRQMDRTKSKGSF